MTYTKLEDLPARSQLLIKAGLADLDKVLDQFNEQENKEFDTDDLPF